MLLTNEAICGIMYPIEDTGRFILPAYISQSGRLVSSINIKANWLADIFEGEMDTKRCSKCGEYKSLDNFNLDKGGSYGRYRWCKQCVSAYRKGLNYPSLTEGTKVCSICGIEKSVLEFSREKTAKSGLQSACKCCIGEKQRSPESKIKRKEYRKRPEERTKSIERSKRYYAKVENKERKASRLLMQKYGITLEDKIKLLMDQQGVCAICEKEIYNPQDAYVDHNHVTGKIRGILCSECNLGLGIFKDSIMGVERALNYLKEADV